MEFPCLTLLKFCSAKSLSLPRLKESLHRTSTSAWTHLNTAYNNFFKKPKTGFPKFKSKKRSKDVYTTFNQSGTIKIVDNKIKLPKVGFVKAKISRVIPFTTKNFIKYTNVQFYTIHC